MLCEMQVEVDEDTLSAEEQKERRIMKLLLKIKNGTPPMRKVEFLFLCFVCASCLRNNCRISCSKNATLQDFCLRLILWVSSLCPMCMFACNDCVWCVVLFLYLQSALRHITDKARELGAGPLFNQILPLLMSPTLEDQVSLLSLRVTVMEPDWSCGTEAVLEVVKTYSTSLHYSCVCDPDCLWNSVPHPCDITPYCVCVVICMCFVAGETFARQGH